jgi:peptidoglycan/LPS O-acetylase OafA/YrhL
MNRIRFLDTCRCIAVLLVAIGHIILTGSSEGDSLARVFGEETKGNYPVLSHFNSLFTKLNMFLGTAGTGVCLFFLITGYIMPLTILRKKNSLDFLISRFFRILPPALLVMIVVHIFLVLFLKINFHLIDFVTTYINSLFNGMVVNANFLHAFEPFWTLSIEIIFYIWIATIGKKINFATIVFTQTLCILFYLRTHIAVFGFLIFIFLGSLFFFIEKEFKDQNKCTTKTISKILLFCIIFAVFMCLNKIISVYVEKCFYSSFLIFCLFYLLHTKLLFPKILQKVISFIADISYSFYLLHVPVGIGFALFLKLHYNITNPYIQTLCAFLLSFVLSYLCYLFIEKPSIKFGKFMLHKVETIIFTR